MDGEAGRTPYRKKRGGSEGLGGKEKLFVLSRAIKRGKWREDDPTKPGGGGGGGSQHQGGEKYFQKKKSKRDHEGLIVVNGYEGIPTFFFHQSTRPKSGATCIGDQKTFCL